MKRVYRNILIAVGILLGLFLILRISVIRELVNLIIVAFIISYALKPLMRRITGYGVNRSLSAMLLIATIISMFFVSFIILIPGMFKESLTINNTLLQLKEFADRINDNIAVIGSNKTIDAISNTVYEKLNGRLLRFFNNAFENFLSLGENLLSLAVIPVLVYYFLAEQERIANRALLFVPVESRMIVKKICSDIDRVLSRYIVSQFFLSFLIGGMTFIILLALGVEYPLLLSLLNAIFNIIPYFGPLFGALPAVLMAVLKSPQAAIWAAVCLYIVQQIEGDIISPKITGDSVNIHPLVVILLLLLGGKIGGFFGMVLAVPVGVIIKIIYEDLNYYLF